MTPQVILHDVLNRVRANGPGLRLGVAVSGGGDSMALLRLAHDWCRDNNATLWAATVDHGLRSEAADEARFVADVCGGLDVAHTTLALGELPSGNLQGAARAARYTALAGWAQDHLLDAVLLGHTADDQAETFVMRLARGSGVDGLAAMRHDWTAQGVRWLRPLLSIDRATLREYLADQNQRWVEDPSNDDPKFERVRVRQAMQDLAALGLDPDRLIETAQRMQDARVALSHAACRAAQDCARVHGGDLHLNKDHYCSLPRETRHRLLAEAVIYVSSSTYRPRYAALCALEQYVLAGTTRTLQGCLVTGTANDIVIGRELNAVSGMTTTPGACWDGRWVIAVPAGDETGSLVVKALGEGVRELKNWRETGFGRNTLMTSPALWEGSQLIAAPLAGLDDPNLILRKPCVEDFLHRLLSH
ncbi:tRNA lysidine(34) synthetase TilS [Aliiroseovarius sp. 2305UL8-7]|uniref:tRNA lysidine(34) synthetase TilS n=1 Tax=Aliiroseovarius conchicola TaxID=3121637 RepID=UPI003528B5AB